MVAFIGTKIIQASPMTRGEYNTYREWPAPEGEDQSASGYLVEYLDGGTGNLPDHTGYISWSPAGVFEKSYWATNGLSFGLAIGAMKFGKRVRRSGWNGKGMWICQGQGHPALEASSFWNPHTRAFAEDHGGTAEVLPYIIMKTADDKILMGWLASQSDMLADDWQVID